MIGIYPGSFDPITNGHLDIVARPGIPASSGGGSEECASAPSFD